MAPTDHIAQHNHQTQQADTTKSPFPEQAHAAGRTVPEQEHPGRCNAARAGLALAAAGVLFIAYPVLRPWADETTLAGAEAMASTAWVASHMFGMVAFALTTLGITWIVGTARHGRLAGVAAWLGTLLVLPYYGAETFGLQVIAQRALDEGDASLLVLAEDFRMGAAPVTMFGLGLAALAIAGVALAMSVWRHGRVNRLGGLLAGTALVMYLPQFFAPPVLRITHGAVLGAGLILLAITTATGHRSELARPE